MKNRRLSPALAALSLLAVTSTVGATAAHASSGRTAGYDATLRPWTGGDLTGTAAFTDTGAVAADRQVSVDLVLQRPDPAGEAAYERALSTPGSAVYQQFLDVDAFAARFGVDQATFDHAVAFATAHGMTVRSSSPTRDSLALAGTAAQVEATFGTGLETYSFQGTDFFANTSSPLVPAGLPVIGLFGLETLHRAHTASAVSTAPTQTSCTGGVCIGDLTPQDLWSIYDQPSGDTGQNQKLTIFGQGTYQQVITDLRAFEKANALPVVPVSVILADGADTGTNYTDSSGDDEWDIDMQASTGMAPDVKELDLVWGTTYNFTSLYNLLAAWTDTKGTSNAASASYSDCEPFPGSGTATSSPAGSMLDVSTPAYLKASEQKLTQAVLEGKTLFSSSGDTGGSCDPGPVPNAGVTGGTVDVGYPASSPHAVGVGGTTLYGTKSTAVAPASNATRSMESAWTGSGGGNSNVYSEPAYQKAVLSPTTAPAAPDTACLYDADVTPDTSGRICRKVPDVSAVSGDLASNGFTVYGKSGSSSGGGTSLSSPLTLGMWARLQAASCTVSPSGVSGVGYANPVYYAHTGDFFDVGDASTTKSTPVSNTPWDSNKGYDDVTGLGVPDVAKLVKDVTGAVVPCATAPTDLATFPSTTPTTQGTAASTLPTVLPESHLPVLLVGLGAVVGGAVLVRRRRAA